MIVRYIGVSVLVIARSDLLRHIVNFYLSSFNECFLQLVSFEDGIEGFDVVWN